MVETRWLRWVGPGLIAVVAIAAVATTAAGAGPRLWAPPDCPSDAGDPATAARSDGPATPGDLRTVPWYRVDPRLDRTGALVGQRLALGVDGLRSSQYVDLPAESFAAGPFGRLILVGADDGASSRLAAIDVVIQCSWPLATEASVIRRATIDPAGQTVYEMRVDRATRDDLGIWARPVDGSSSAVRVVEPIAADQRFGPTFTTELIWSLAGDRLAVQSCGEIACRTRLIDPATGGIVPVTEPDLGSMIGHQDGVIVTYAACPGLPCPIVAIDTATGARSRLADSAAVAILVSTSDGTRLIHELASESGFALRSVALDGSSVDDVGGLANGIRLHGTAVAADSATDLPPGWVLLSPDARLPDDGPRSNTQLRHVPDGLSVAIDEVVR